MSDTTPPDESPPPPAPARPPPADPAPDDAAGEEAPARPLSVRESLPDRGPRPPRPAPARPTPVRKAMGPERVEEPPEAPTVPFRHGEEEWVARVVGRALTGLPPDPGRAPLLLLSFARADAPDEPVLEAVRVGRRLDDLSEDDLSDALAAARPHRGDQWERGELFPDTRKDRGRR